MDTKIDKDVITYRKKDDPKISPKKKVENNFETLSAQQERELYAEC